MLTAQTNPFTLHQNDFVAFHSNILHLFRSAAHFSFDVYTEFICSTGIDFAKLEHLALLQSLHEIPIQTTQTCQNVYLIFAFSVWNFNFRSQFLFYFNFFSQQTDYLYLLRLYFYFSLCLIYVGFLIASWNCIYIQWHL